MSFISHLSQIFKIFIHIAIEITSKSIELDLKIHKRIRFDSDSQLRSAIALTQSEQLIQKSIHQNLLLEIITVQNTFIT